ncbi:MAG: SNF2 family DNA or RNA helicase, partial [Myxococcota bacterium]
FSSPGKGKARTGDVLRAWRAGASLVPLDDGGWAPLPIGWLERFGSVVSDIVAAKQAAGELPPSAFADVTALCRDLDVPPPRKLGHLRDQFSAGIQPATLPSDLRAELRDYQRAGVDWLSFLRDGELGGMLADDMGLGKTLQALCAIRGRTLVVAPTSVLYNWAREIEKFRPELTVNVFHGPKRKDDPDADVTLTSYAIMRIEIERLTQEMWDSVVLDEAQYIKNPDSKVARAAYRLRGRFKLTLTGTPVENRLDELWSQVHFANPGLLGDRKDFQERYAKPIAEGTPGVAKHLRERLRPFLLRRLKRDVAPELPARTDLVLRCELTEAERTVYEGIRLATREEVVSRLRQGGGVLQALEALLRLRQAACHSGLIPGLEAETSSKVDTLLDTLDTACAEGHKALVFSQWTSLLDRIEPRLEGAGLKYVRLDGRTRDRQAVVDAFQDPDGPPVMLLSLKAGGTGLNLTAADHVFMMDPWWNPAVEDQAADRAHRIGQERPVFVHRLVAADTVEEGILALQERKRALADAALAGADRAASLTRDDLLALLN